MVNLRRIWDDFAASPAETVLDTSSPASIASGTVVAFVLGVVPAYIPPLQRIGQFRAPWLVFGLFLVAITFSYGYYRVKGRGPWAPVFTLADSVVVTAALSVAVITTAPPAAYGYAVLQGLMLNGVHARAYALTVPLAVGLGLASVGLVGVFRGLGAEFFIVLCGYAFAMWVSYLGRREREMKSHNRRLRQALEVTGGLADRSMEVALASTAIAMGTFIHELRNHLSGVGTNLQFAREADPTDPDLRPAIEDALAAHKKTVAILDEHLNRLRIKKKDKAATSYRLHEAVRDVVEAVDRRALAVHLEADDRMPFAVDGDEQDLCTVIENLLRNSREAKATEVSIRCAVDPGGAIGSIEVVDNGPGFHADIAESLFHPFATAGKDGTGLGLGLYLVRRQIELMGGTVEATSAAGGGARFLIKVPGRLIIPVLNAEQQHAAPA